MFALAVARVIEHRRRRPRSTKTPIVPHVNPASPGVGLGAGQDRHGRIVRMKALGRHDVSFYEAKLRIKGRADRSYRVCHGRKRDWNASQSITLGLTVQRLMLAEFLKH